MTIFSTTNAQTQRTPVVPNPGSHEAYTQGCTCPIIDNQYGRGYHEDAAGNRYHVIEVGCPLHNRVPAAPASQPGQQPDALAGEEQPEEGV
jgi:hypothetical protein